MTVRECARLQTFADDFKFVGSISRQFTQVGNAVPPLLAEHFARKIMTDVFRKSIPSNMTHEDNISNKSVARLTHKILSNAIEEKVDWVYHTHA